MNKLLKYSLGVLLCGALGLQGCKDYFDLNQNPNQVANPPLSALLSTATQKTGLRSFDVGAAVAPYVQYTANPSAGASSDTYQIVDYSGTWDNLYYSMADITDMKNKAIEQNASEYLGVANVLLSYHVSLVNDLWGSAPFSEAANPTILTPAFDSQEELYNTSLRLIEEAIVELSKTDATLKLAATSDLIHAGDRVKWLKTAHALKARLLNKVSKTPRYNAAQVLDAVSKSYTSNADDAGMATFQLRNPWAQLSRDNASLTLGGWLSEQLIDHLNGTTYGVVDPRIRKITDPVVLADKPNYPQYIGTVNGAGNRDNRRPSNNTLYNNTVRDENYISSNSPWTSDTAPILIVTYSEVKFIEAEAALRANDRARAYTAYLAGIRANMDRFQVPPAERDAYLANPVVGVGASALTLDLIFKEKYVATYLNPEAWNDARRHNYGYKDFTLPQNAVLSTFIRRLEYPSNERNENGKNVPTVGSLADKLWWDI